MTTILLCVVACVAAFVGGPATAATINVKVSRPISRAVIEFDVCSLPPFACPFPFGLGEVGLDNLINVSGTDLQFLNFDELPLQSFDNLSIGNTRFSAAPNDASLDYDRPVFGFDPGPVADTVFTDSLFLLLDANTRLIMEFTNPVDILQFGMVFAPNQRDETRMGTVQLFGVGRNFLGAFDFRADFEPGDEFSSAKFTAAVVQVPAAGMLLLSALGLGRLLRFRPRSA